MRLNFAYITLLLTLPACGPGTGTTDATTTGSTSTGPNSGSSTGEPTTAGTTTDGTTTDGTITGVTTTATPTTDEPGTTTVEPGTTGEPGTTTLGPGTTTGMTPGEVECTEDADCKLNEDCCVCDAIPVREEGDFCDLECIQSKCAEFGVEKAVCNLGVCEPARLSCDASKIACDEKAPECPAGTVPQTTPACWTGLCVPAALCDVVPDCAACPGDMMCVQKVAFVTESSCQPIPPGCGGEIACECVADLVCIDGFGACSVAGPVVQCECPNC